jgi:hypothetical protein
MTDLIARKPGDDIDNRDLPTAFSAVRDWFKEEPRRIVFLVFGVLLVIIFIAMLVTANNEAPARRAPTPTPISFTVSNGEGLTRHVSFGTSVAIAEHFGLPLYEGRQMREDRRITPARARLLEPITDERQVTVRIRPGTTFVLGDPTNPSTWAMYPPNDG